MGSLQPMKLITRVIILELLVAIAEGTMLFTFVFFLKRLYDLTDLLVTGGTTLVSTLVLLFSILPSIMVLTFPMAVLLASLLVYGRMAQDNELTALQAAGYSAVQLLKPVLLVGFILTLLMLWWHNRIAPKGLRLFDSVAADVLQNTSTTGIRPGNFNILGDFIIVPSTIDEGGMHSVRIFERRGEEIAGVISAPSGTIKYFPRENSIQINLERGTVHQIQSRDRASIIQFQELRFTISIQNLLRKMAKTGKWPQKFTNDGLRKTLRDYHNAPPEARTPGFTKMYHQFLVELNYRRTLPFACLIMAGVGALLGMKSGFGKRSACYGMTIAIIFSYYILLNFGKTYAEEGTLPAWFALWIPNWVCALTGGYFFYRTQRV